MKRQWPTTIIVIRRASDRGLASESLVSRDLLWMMEKPRTFIQRVQYARILTLPYAGFNRIRFRGCISVRMKGTPRAFESILATRAVLGKNEPASH